MTKEEKQALLEKHHYISTTLVLQIALNKLDELGRTAYPKNDLTQLIEPLVKELIKEEVFYDSIFTNYEANIVKQYDTYDKFIKVMSTVNVWEMENLMALKLANDKDPNTLLPVVNGILEDKTKTKK